MKPVIEDRQVVLTKIRFAMQAFYALDSVKDCTDSEHTINSPDRIAKSFMELYEGCWQDPKECLKTVFKNQGYDEMIYVNDISFISMCAHHGLPFVGKANFAYIPDKYIVGLSKIPRLVQCYSRRPQIQENLTMQIVETFNEIVKPKGCALVMESYHLCVSIRGVKNENAYTKTSSLKGVFREGSTKQEFLDGIRKTTEKIWP